MASVRLTPCKRNHSLDRSRRTKRQWVCLDCRAEWYSVRNRKNNAPSTLGREVPCYRGHPVEESKWSCGQWSCGPCRLIASRKSKYGLSEEARQEMVDKQNGQCGCCGKVPDDYYGLIVEHNHETNQVRALTCQPCNITLGAAKEDIKRLQACIEYLERHNG